MTRHPPRSTLFPYTTLFRSTRVTRPEESRRAMSSREFHAKVTRPPSDAVATSSRSEEHTSELQSQSNLVCRLLLEKKKSKNLPVRTFLIRSSYYSETLLCHT